MWHWQRVTAPLHSSPLNLLIRRVLHRLRRLNVIIGLDAQVRYLDSDRIEISIDNRRAVLSSAVAGSGERYVGTTGLWGHGGEWHQKGDLAFFSYTGLHGAKGDSKCQRVYR